MFLREPNNLYVNHSRDSWLHSNMAGAMDNLCSNGAKYIDSEDMADQPCSGILQKTTMQDFSVTRNAPIGIIGCILIPGAENSQPSERLVRDRCSALDHLSRSRCHVSSFSGHTRASISAPSFFDTGEKNDVALASCVCIFTQKTRHGSLSRKQCQC